MNDVLTHEQILNASSNGVIATDASGIIVYASRQVEQSLGFSIEEILRLKITDVLPFSGPLVMEALRTAKPLPDGHILGQDMGLMMTISLIWQLEQLKGAVCSFQSMEQFGLSAPELETYKSLNKQLNAIFESSSDGIWVCDGQGKVINLNSASEKLNGVRACDMMGRNIADIMAGGLFDRSVTIEVLQTRRQVSVMQFIRRTGRTLLVTGTPVFDEDGSICMVVVNERDMTQLNGLRERMEQSRMETEKYRDELAEMIAMDLERQQIVAENGSMRQVLEVALKVARLEISNVLLLGESGTGKGLLAKFIHKNGKRSKKPFIAINCAALPESLLEAELFGYEKGAFTGAREQGKAGLFELAHTGTLFLDEVGDMPLSIQAKLLKYLDDFEVLRLGGLKSKKIDCTVIAATNRDLEGLVRNKLFRQDLLYRLNTFTVRIPPLRERMEDIFELVRHYVRKYNRAYQLRKRISPEALELLQSYPFPGNVRELKSILKRAILMSDQDVLDDFVIAGLGIMREKGARRTAERGERTSLADGLRDLERRTIESALLKCKSTRELAKVLGVSQPTVVRKLRKYGFSSTSIQ
ncbi:MAG: sigma 54-interacting transcriptional regulator [Syntrophobacteraceae bacterium]